MRLFIALCVLAALVGSGVFAWDQGRQRQVEVRLRIAAVRLADFGAVRHDRVDALPWRTGSVHGLRLEPAAALRESLNWPASAQPRAERIDLLDYAEYSPNTPQRVRVRVRGLVLPLSTRRAPPALAAEPADNPLPTVADLGFSQLTLAGELHLEYRRESSLLRVQAVLEDPAFAAFDLDCSLAASDAVFAADFTDTSPQSCRLDIRDRGWLAATQSLMAGRSRVGIETLEESLIARLDAVVRQRAPALDTAIVEALATFIRNPVSLRVAIDPPGTPQWRNLKLYSPDQLVQTLDVSVVSPLPAP